MKVIPSRMFIKPKVNTIGEITKYKARLVAGGHRQIRTIYDNNSSPTARTTSILICALQAARENRHVFTVDITGAYLNAKMTEDVYMRLDPIITQFAKELDKSYGAFVEPNGTCIVKLDRALYGCIQSAKLWYDNISQLLLANGFAMNPYDPCVFNKTTNGVQCTIVLYVDDKMITTARESDAREVIALLEEAYGEITVKEGKEHEYLGMLFKFEKGKVRVTMPGYTDEILQLTGTTKFSETPAHDKLFVVGASPPLDDAKRENFHSIVAKLLFMAMRTRPDILLAISYLTTRVQDANEDDEKKLNRVLAYLNSTRSLGIVLEGSDIDQLLCWCDASHACHPDMKGHKGMVMGVGKGPVMVRSTKLRMMTKSSTESELVAASDCGSDILFVRNFIMAQGKYKSPAKLFQDNQSTVKLLLNGRDSSKNTRHVSIHHFWLKEQIALGNLVVEWIETGEMIADILTKPLPRESFVRLRRLLLNWNEE
jgi:hypothetical protein